MNDPVILGYQASEIRIAAEFLTNWLPFLTRDLCGDCTQKLGDRIRSLDPDLESSGDGQQSAENACTENFAENACTENLAENACTENFADMNLNGSELNENENENSDNCDTNSLGSWKDGANGWSDNVALSHPSPSNEWSDSGVTPSDKTSSVRMSWADMAQEDELEEEGNKAESSRHDRAEGQEVDMKVQKKAPTLSRDQREHIRFMNVRRKKDFICLERIKGKITNILDGLELHTGVFSAAEQKRVVDFVYELQEKGRNGELKERTYSAPNKWMRGKGRETIQFGCCYNYAMDKTGNPPGILLHEVVDPIPHLFKVIIRRLVGWHVVPPSCVPDSCIVNIYEEGDCIPPHIDNHDFVRPFCTVSFLSECNILFGSNLKIVGAGDFSGSAAIPLPVGSVLVLNGNGADIAKHCVPAVPTKRISITFRRMDEEKRPFGFVPEPDLQGLQPLPYGLEKSMRTRPSKLQPNTNRRMIVDGVSDRERQSAGWGGRAEQTRPSRNRMRSNKPRGRPNTLDV